MRYIAVMTDLWGLDGMLVKLARLNVRMVSLSAADHSTRRKAAGRGTTEADRPADRATRPLPERVWVGLLASEDNVDAAMRTILKSGKNNQAEVMDLVSGLFGGRLKAGRGERRASMGAPVLAHAGGA